MDPIPADFRPGIGRRSGEPSFPVSMSAGINGNHQIAHGFCVAEKIVRQANLEILLQPGQEFHAFQTPKPKIPAERSPQI
jgi:hypothetical protein